MYVCNPSFTKEVCEGKGEFRTEKLWIVHESCRTRKETTLRVVPCLSYAFPHVESESVERKMKTDAPDKKDKEPVGLERQRSLFLRGKPPAFESLVPPCLVYLNSTEHISASDGAIWLACSRTACSICAQTRLWVGLRMLMFLAALWSSSFAPIVFPSPDAAKRVSTSQHTSFPI